MAGRPVEVIVNVFAPVIATSHARSYPLPCLALNLEEYAIEQIYPQAFLLEPGVRFSRSCQHLWISVPCGMGTTFGS